jgi:RNA 2',3'-cyclic 3'-phosphodiesterase
MARLFFALWPDEDARRALGALAHDVARVAGGKPAPPEKIHLTLAFLGEIPAERCPELIGAAREIRGAPFTLKLDRVGSFRRARVAWAGTSEAPRALVDLQAALAARLASRGFGLEEREFAPHLTLARRIERSLPPASIAPIAMRATALALVASETGTGRYTTLDTWPLADKK